MPFEVKTFDSPSELIAFLQSFVDEKPEPPKLPTARTTITTIFAKDGKAAPKAIRVRTTFENMPEGESHPPQVDTRELSVDTDHENIIDWAIDVTKRHASHPSVKVGLMGMFQELEHTVN